MSFSSFSTTSQIYVNFVTYDFNRQEFDQLICTYFEDETTCPFTHIVYQYERNYNISQERDCHIQGFLRLKKKTKFGHYKPSTDEKKNKINGIKGFLKIDKIHFEPVGSEPDSIRYCKKTYNKCSIHNRKEVEHDVERFLEYEFIRNTISTSNKKRVTNCRCSYDDLNDFLECKWCTLECCSQRTLARYDENSGPYEFSIQEKKKIQIKKNQSQDQLLKDAQECMDDILVKKISKEEAIVKYAEKNPQWITQNPNNIAIICDTRDKLL